MGKKRKVFWILIGIGVSLVFLFILASNVIDVGIKLRNVSVWLEYAFYVVAALLVWFLIINPVRIILFSPSFSIQTVLDEDTKKNRKLNKRVAKNLVKQSLIDEMDKEKIKNALNQDAALKEELVRVFNGSVKKELNKIILSNAKTVMLSTAISQNSKLDMFAVVTVNLKMIKEMVLRCGFRPSYPNLGKLSFNVLSTALIAEGLENMNLDDMLPTSAMNALGEIPFIKPVISSTLQGISNALLTIRIGIVTRKYLFADAGALTKTEIRIQAMKEALILLPIVVKDALLMFPSKIAKVFAGAMKNTQSEAEEA